MTQTGVAAADAALRRWFDEDEWLAAEVGDWGGYADAWFVQHVLDVVTCMRGGAPVEGVEELALCVTCDSDGAIEGFVMRCPVLLLVGGEKVRGYVAEWLELNEATTDVGAEGAAGAWAIVEALVLAWDRLRAQSVCIQMAAL